MAVAALVDCRIGSLEKLAQTMYKLDFVDCRIGSLEREREYSLLD